MSSRAALYHRVSTVDQNPDAAQRGEIDVVLVWKLDRFGRSALGLLKAKKQSKISSLSNCRRGLLTLPSLWHDPLVLFLALR